MPASLKTKTVTENYFILQDRKRRHNIRVSKKEVGYQGTHNISVLGLIHYIPFSRLKAAAKKFLKHSGIKKKRKRKSNKKKNTPTWPRKGLCQ
jgi:hypothetical protein